MSKTRIDLVIRGAREILTCAPAPGNPVGRIWNADIAIRGESIAAIGPRELLERDYDFSGSNVLDAASCIVAPGFVDCHTHLVFGGSRAAEYGARMTRTAAEVRALGISTGIQATVAMTRSASRGELVSAARAILGRMFRAGTTTVESKSGYGLSVEKEIELLEVNRDLMNGIARDVQTGVARDSAGASPVPVDLVSTFLGAHDFPKDMSRTDYLDSIIHEMLPRVASGGLASFCDVYCDEGYYTAEESRRILEAGLRAGLRPKIHVDAYSSIGGSSIAAELGAVSADHLNYTNRKEMAAYAKAGTVGVIMPGLDFAVRHPHPFDARAMLDEGMTLALATDFCPACWMESMQMVMQLACRLYALSPEEALLAATTGAARALALEDRGALAPGLLADLQIWDIPGLEDLIYRIGNNSVSMIVKRGQVYDFREATP